MTIRYLHLCLIVAAVLSTRAALGGSAGGDSGVQWREAPQAKVFAGRSHLTAGSNLEQLAAAAAVQQGPSATPAKTSHAVVEGEWSPVRYRRIIRRYFELIRARR